MTVGEMPSALQRLAIGCIFLAIFYLSSLFRLHTTTLGGAASVVGDGGDVLDHRHLQAHGLQCADGSLTALAGALDKDLHGLQAMLHSGLGSRLSGTLGSEGGRLLAATEAQTTGGGPGQSVARFQLTMHTLAIG